MFRKICRNLSLLKEKAEFLSAIKKGKKNVLKCFRRKILWIFLFFYYYYKVKLKKEFLTKKRKKHFFSLFLSLQFIINFDTLIYFFSKVFSKIHRIISSLRSSIVSLTRVFLKLRIPLDLSLVRRLYKFIKEFSSIPSSRLILKQGLLNRFLKKIKGLKAKFSRKTKFKGNFKVFETNLFEKSFTNLLENGAFFDFIKSKKVAHYLSKYFFVFIKRRVRVDKRPFRMDMHPRSFFFRNRRKDRSKDYLNFRKLKVFFGMLRPAEFWKKNRRVKNCRSLDKLHSYLDLQLDFILYQLNFGRDIFEVRRLIREGNFSIDGRSVRSNLFIKPFILIGLQNRFKCDIFRKKLVSMFILSRGFDFLLNPLPSNVEFNFRVMKFIRLPLFDSSNLYRPIYLDNSFSNQGRMEII